MTHLGDICKINGAEADPVDVIIGGSPCQDLSVAGKRAGLDGERSGLFMEQIRIIKEMRNADKLRHTNASSTDCGEGGTTTVESGITQHGFCGTSQFIRPRYMVWENVPGAFSSNKGEDFRVVLEETAKIADETAVIPRPDKGEWTNAGAIMGDGWSIAWRVLDAQFWGVPQRRRRIALVADFGGQSAPEILFERNGVSGDIAESGAQGEGVAGDVERSIDTPIWDIGDRRKVADESAGVSPALLSKMGTGGNNVPIVPTYFLQGNGIDRADTAGNVVVAGFCQGASPAAQTIGHQEEVSPTIKGAPSGTAQVPAVFSFDSLSSNSMKSSNPHSGCRQVEIAKCIDTTNPDPSKNQGGMAVLFEPRSQDGVPRIHDKICPTLNTAQGGQRQPCVAEPIALDRAAYNQGKNAQYDMGIDEIETAFSLTAKGPGAVAYQSVRRLTPLECERLQGFEDSWTDIPPQAEVTAEDLSFWRTVWDEWQTMNGKKPKTDKQIIKWLQSEPADSARYKALGNSIALPPWRFVLSRIHKQGAQTMASLFDGIGGFPKIWDELGGQTLWASEVDPFPIAVTRYHFKEETP